MNRSLLNTLAMEMVHYYRDDPARIQHFLKVHAFSRLIAEEEGLTENLRFPLEAAAYVHDIGIKPAEAQYHSTAGPYQERLGPPIAREMLQKLGFPPETVERVAFLVGHHHTYSAIDGPDYQILVEADFLVNLYEDEMTDPVRRQAAARTACERIFVTETGKRLCKEMFL